MKTGQTMAPGPEGLSVRGLQQSRGGRLIFQDLNLDLHPGTAVVLGPNGSGKTTLLRCLATVDAPDAGLVVFNGRVYSTYLRAIRAQLGYMPQDLDLPETMTPRRLLEYLAHLKGIDARSEAAQALTVVGLSSLADRPIGTLSGGQVRLVGAAQAFLGNPRLIVLDEPMHGLDATERNCVQRVIRRPCPGRLVLCSTNIAGEIGSLFTQVIVLFEGRMCYTGTVEGLRQIATRRVYEMRLDAGQAEPWLRSGARLLKMERGIAVLRIIADENPKPEWLSVEPTMEDGYLALLRQIRNQKKGG